MTFFRETWLRYGSQAGNLPLSLWWSSPGHFKAGKSWWGGYQSDCHSLVNPEETWNCASRKSQISELNFCLVSPGSHARSAGSLGSHQAAHVEKAEDDNRDRVTYCLAYCW